MPCATTLQRRGSWVVSVYLWDTRTAATQLFVSSLYISWIHVLQLPSCSWVLCISLGYTYCSYPVVREFYVYLWDTRTAATQLFVSSLYISWTRILQLPSCLWAVTLLPWSHLTYSGCQRLMSCYLIAVEPLDVLWLASCSWAVTLLPWSHLTYSGWPGVKRATQVRLMVLPRSTNMSGPPRISVTGSAQSGGTC